MRLHVGRLLKPARELCSVRSLFSANGLIDVNPEVSAALHANEAVVALESTIITHGMPYPKNLETALRVEEIIRSQGAIPATVAVISGRVKAGLTQSQLELLAQTPATKTSRRDLANVVMAGGNGGTTVAGTMVVAAAVGINVFVTGGIGGVHRGGESSMDVSADLSELARSPVAVVCAGVKAILDIPRTLEYLETQGVCVAALGPDPDFPAFYSRSSGLRAPVHARDVHAAARLVDTSLRLRLGGGVLLATPIPSEHDIPREEMERVIAVALREASEQCIVGKEITPFLLARVNQLTKGRSLSANIALVENNALVGAQVALALSEIQRSRQRGETSSGGWIPSFNEPKTEPARELPSDPHSPASVVVVGGSVVDCVISVQDKLLKVPTNSKGYQTAPTKNSSCLTYRVSTLSSNRLPRDSYARLQKVWGRRRRPPPSAATQSINGDCVATSRRKPTPGIVHQLIAWPAASLPPSPLPAPSPFRYREPIR